MRLLHLTCLPGDAWHWHSPWLLTAIYTAQTLMEISMCSKTFILLLVTAATSDCDWLLLWSAVHPPDLHLQELYICFFPLLLAIKGVRASVHCRHLGSIILRAMQGIKDRLYSYFIQLGLLLARHIWQAYSRPLSSRQLASNDSISLGSVEGWNAGKISI